MREAMDIDVVTDDLGPSRVSRGRVSRSARGAWCSTGASEARDAPKETLLLWGVTRFSSTRRRRSCEGSADGDLGRDPGAPRRQDLRRRGPTELAPARKSTYLERPTRILVPRLRADGDLGIALWEHEFVVCHSVYVARSTHADGLEVPRVLQPVVSRGVDRVRGMGAGESP